MKKITEKMAEAIKNKRNWKLSNTQVVVFENDNMEVYLIEVYLHGNLIAEIKPLRDDYHMWLKTCGWQTNVTKERLNGILEALGVNAWIVQRNYKWYLYNNTDMVEFESQMYLASANHIWLRANLKTGVFENV